MALSDENRFSKTFAFAGLGSRFGLYEVPSFWPTESISKREKPKVTQANA